MIETDGPFLSPHNLPDTYSPELSQHFRKRNEPCLLDYVVKKLAECMGETEENLAKQTYKNTVEFFGLK